MALYLDAVQQNHDITGASTSAAPSFGIIDLQVYNDLTLDKSTRIAPDSVVYLHEKNAY